MKHSILLLLIASVLSTAFNFSNASDGNIDFQKVATTDTGKISCMGYNSNSNMLYASGQSGTILISNDAQNWTLAKSDNANSVNSIFCDDTSNKVFATGGNGTVLFSKDGTSFSRAKTTITNTLNCIAKGIDLFVCGGDGAILYSTDGESWNQSSLSRPDLSIIKIVWNSKVFVALAVSNKGKYITSSILISTDGKAWTDVTPANANLTRYTSYSDIAWDGSSFTICSLSGEMLTSNDGHSWNTGKASGILEINKIIWIGDNYLALSTKEHTIYSSVDAANWQQIGYISDIPTDMVWDGLNLFVSTFDGSFYKAILKDEVKVLYNNLPILFKDVAPIISSGRTLIPARLLFERAGANVFWDSNSKKVTINGQKIKIELVVNSKEAIVNGEKMYLDVPATIVRGRTVIPLRFVSEKLGLNVGWNSVDKIVSVNGKL